MDSLFVSCPRKGQEGLPPQAEGAAAIDDDVSDVSPLDKAVPTRSASEAGYFTKTQETSEPPVVQQTGEPCATTMAHSSVEDAPNLGTHGNWRCSQQTQQENDVDAVNIDGTAQICERRSHEAKSFQRRQDLAPEEDVTLTQSPLAPGISPDETMLGQFEHSVDGIELTQLRSGDGSNRDSQQSTMQQPVIQPPERGLRAWLNVVGAFMAMTMVFGIVNSFGTFQAYYQDKFPNMATSTITWIGSMQLFILFLGGVIVGPVFDRWGSRKPMQLGTFLVVLSSVANSLSTEYYQLLLSQGLLFGIGSALVYHPAIGAISEWFDGNRGLALGIAVSGASAGGIVWPLVLNRVLATLGETWTHLIICLVSLPVLAVSCLLVKEKAGSRGRDSHGNEAPREVLQLRWMDTLLEWRFLMLSGSLFFLYSGMLVPFYWIPSYAESYGFSATEGNVLLAIGYAGSFVRRIGAGWLSDYIGRFNMLVGCGLLTSIIIFCWTTMTTYPGMFAFAYFFGLFSGGILPLGSACVAQTTPNMAHIGLRIGGMMAIASIGGLAGGPVSGVILDESKKWVGVHVFAASATLLGSLMLYVTKLIHEPSWTSVF